MTVVDLFDDGLSEWRARLALCCPGCGCRAIADGVCTKCGSKKKLAPVPELGTWRPSIVRDEQTPIGARDSAAPSTYDAPNAAAPPPPPVKKGKRRGKPAGVEAAPPPAPAPAPARKVPAAMQTSLFAGPPAPRRKP